MRNSFLLNCCALIALAGCSSENTPDSAAEAVEAAAESAVSADAAVSSESIAADPGIVARAELPTGIPKLAYAYGLSYRLPSADIDKLMRSHANVCEQQGAGSCRIVGMDLSGDPEDDSARGTLQLAVAASHARAVSALLDEEAEGAGAEQVKATIGSEEVSKQIVDTEARIRAREALRDRLTEVLRTRKGSVSELVAAERSVAEVNEEIDQARSWLAETKGRGLRSAGRRDGQLSRSDRRRAGLTRRNPRQSRRGVNRAFGDRASNSGPRRRWIVVAAPFDRRTRCLTKTDPRR